MKNGFGLAPAEEEIMQLLWQTGRKMPSKEILDYFNTHCNKDWRKQTLNTLLSRLLSEKYIERTSQDRRYLYSPVVSKKEYEQSKAENFIKNAYNGCFLNFVSALSGGDLISAEQAREINRIIERGK